MFLIYLRARQVGWWRTRSSSGRTLPEEASAGGMPQAQLGFGGQRKHLALCTIILRLDAIYMM